MFQITKYFLLILVSFQVSALSGGRNANVAEFPAFVGIILPTNNQICGASIFNRNHVLTIANCMLNTNNLLLAPNQISIVSGTNTLNFALPRTQVQAIYVHPAFNPFTFENDIAVVRTLTDFIFPQVPTPLTAPAEISSRIGEIYFQRNLLKKNNFIILSAFDTENCIVAAWNTNNNLQQALAVPIINRDICNSLAANFGRIAESMLCAGSTGTGSGACNFNRGGSLYCNNRLEGVLNSGFSCGTLANTPGVYTQVRYYLDWIDEQVSRQDIPPANVSPIERLP